MDGFSRSQHRDEFLDSRRYNGTTGKSLSQREMLSRTNQALVLK
jgi:hypothetical protein